MLFYRPLINGYQAALTNVAVVSACFGRYKYY